MAIIARRICLSHLRFNVQAKGKNYTRCRPWWASSPKKPNRFRAVSYCWPTGPPLRLLPHRLPQRKPDESRVRDAAAAATSHGRLRRRLHRTPPTGLQAVDAGPLRRLQRRAPARRRRDGRRRRRVRVRARGATGGGPRGHHPAGGVPDPAHLRRRPGHRGRGARWAPRARRRCHVRARARRRLAVGRLPPPDPRPRARAARLARRRGRAPPRRHRARQGELEVDPDDFSLENYFSAKSLLSSRSFRIDSYHGSGMVPLADLFNHKTGGEHVHFTSVLEASDSDSEDGEDPNNASTDEQSTIENSADLPSGDDDEDLEMIVVRDVSAGEEVFNTYGTMGNAALLHRYGFTEIDNPYDIVNIDLALVTKWCSSQYSCRYAIARVSLWHNLGYSGCTSQDADYFEISYDGEPQLELLILLYIISLKSDAYDKLDSVAHDLIGDNEVDSISNVLKVVRVTSSNQHPDISGLEKLPDVKKLLLNGSVCSALVSLADMRESLYGSNTLEDDRQKLRACSSVNERNLYHSLVLRVSERTILHKLKKHASSWSKTKKRKQL